MKKKQFNRKDKGVFKRKTFILYEYQLNTALNKSGKIVQISI